MYSNKDNINILTTLLTQYGVRHIVVCPGSRNAPLVHNFSECPELICHPVTDERSAGFIAIGLRQQLKEQVAVCVTSGSALLNVLPAAAEATYQHQGIIIISADRPLAWIDQLDGQTLPQPNALGKFVSKSVNLPEPHDMTEVWHCKRLVCEAIMDNMVAPYPSVHINVPVTEPLFEFTKEQLPEMNAIIPCRWTSDSERDYLTEMLQQAERPMVVIGQLPDDSITSQQIHKLRENMVVLCEQLSFCEQTYTDQMMAAMTTVGALKDYQPDVVMYLGGHTVSKRLRHFLRNLPDETEVIMVSEDRQLHDVSQHATWLVEGDATTVLTDLAECFKKKPLHQAEFYSTWQSLEDIVRNRHKQFQPEYSSMMAVKCFEENINASKDCVYYGNSMSVRLGAIYADHYCHCNRGVNGIEGSLSVAAGAALSSPPALPHAFADGQNAEEAPLRAEGKRLKEFVFCIIGDLSFFYDENALWQQDLSGNFRIILLNNSQGGIFRNLKGLEKSPVRDELVSARHNATAEGISKQFGITYLKATDEQSLKEGINNLCTMQSDRPVLLEVITDVNMDEQEFKKYYQLFTQQQ